MHLIQILTDVVTFVVIYYCFYLHLTSIKNFLFTQWEEDRVEVRLEGHNRSQRGHLDYSLLAHTITSLDGYRSLQGELNLVASTNTVDAKAAAHWDALNYKLRCKGL